MEENAFAQSRKKEPQRLLLEVTFVKVRESLIDGRTRIFGSKFVDELKRMGDRLKKKSRPVAQIYADEKAATIATKAPQTKRFSQ